MAIITKSFEYKIADVNDAKGIVTIGISAFNTNDSYDDIVRKGAFAKTFKENGSRQNHYIDHDLKIRSRVGIPVKMGETDSHAIVESKLNLSKPIAKDLFEEYKFFAANDRSMEHSFMYETIKTNENKDIKGQDIAELKMYEYSTVGYAAHPNTPMFDMKDFKDIDTLVYELESRLRKCNYTDEKGNYLAKIITAIKGLQEPDFATLKSLFEPKIITQSKSGWEFLK